MLANICYHVITNYDTRIICAGHLAGDIDGDRDFDENTNGDFTGLECSEECTTSTSLRQVSDGSSDSDSGRYYYITTVSYYVSVYSMNQSLIMNRNF